MARVIDDERDAVVVEREREPRSSGVGWVILVILIVLLVLWLLVGGIFNGSSSTPTNGGADSLDVNVQTPSGGGQQ